MTPTRENPSAARRRPPRNRRRCRRRAEIAAAERSDGIPLPKVVFSTTLSEPLSWVNTQLVANDPVEAVREMKDTAAKSMRTIGSLTLCRSLLKAGLVDRFRVVVFPVITGSSGRERIYDGYPDVALEMISSRTFDGRIQLLEYVPTILAGPPGSNGVSA